MDVCVVLVFSVGCVGNSFRRPRGGIDDDAFLWCFRDPSGCEEGGDRGKGGK